MKTSLFLGLLDILYFLEAVAVQYEDSGCPNDWAFYHQNRQCYFISKERATFDVAVKSCENMNSSVASILTSDELHFILPLGLIFEKSCTSFEDCWPVFYWVGSLNASAIYNFVYVCTWIDRTYSSNRTRFCATDFPSDEHKCGMLSLLSDQNEMVACWQEENCDQSMRYICKRESDAVEEVRNDTITDNVPNNTKIMHDCPQGFIRPLGSYNCYKILPEILNNTASSERCRGFDNSRLAIIDSSSENEIVAKYLKEEFAKNSSFCASRYWKDRNQAVWLNGQTEMPGNCSSPYVWKTADGVKIPMNYTNWYSLHPDCSGKQENCIHTADGFDYKWNDLRCNWELCALCQKNIKAK